MTFVVLTGPFESLLGSFCLFRLIEFEKTIQRPLLDFLRSHVLDLFLQTLARCISRCGIYRSTSKGHGGIDSASSFLAWFLARNGALFGLLTVQERRVKSDGATRKNAMLSYFQLGG